MADITMCVNTVCEMRSTCYRAKATPSDWQSTYKPGDQPPGGYLAWHEWAEVQHKAGIKQVKCGKCGLWKTPQELRSKTICNKCVNV